MHGAGTHDSGTWDLQADTIDSSYANDCPVDPNNLPPVLDAVVGSTIAAYERGWSVAQVGDLPSQVAAGEEPATRTAGQGEDIVSIE